MQSGLALIGAHKHVKAGVLSPVLDTSVIRLVLFGAIVFSLGMFESFLYAGAGQTSDSNGILALQVPWACVYFIGIAWSIRHVRSLTTIAIHSKVLLMPPIFAFLSCLAT